MTARLSADRERGAGLIPTVGGVVVFLAFLTFAVQLTLNLYGTSAVTAAAHDAARIVAGSDAGAHVDAVALAEHRARQMLGEVGTTARFEWSITAEVVRLHISADNPRVVLPALGGRLGFDRVDRTVEIRREALR